MTPPNDDRQPRQGPIRLIIPHYVHFFFNPLSTRFISLNPYAEHTTWPSQTTLICRLYETSDHLFATTSHAMHTQLLLPQTTY
ncbi:hypothetical protein K2173_009530 [Erythroxylum novogranatense]|uniref:Uncharacterized protein n=1 Tax=Erythroxylum novogranatense TaxID=1862640 RepID=A0AAV8U7E5_9ROSI|nr:hypothetical protein K2173_009530 [Erythroxylum novogranatense]